MNVQSCLGVVCFTTHRDVQYSCSGCGHRKRCDRKLALQARNIGSRGCKIIKTQCCNGPESTVDALHLPNQPGTWFSSGPSLCVNHKSNLCVALRLKAFKGIIFLRRSGSERVHQGIGRVQSPARPEPKSLGGKLKALLLLMS